MDFILRFVCLVLFAQYALFITEELSELKVNDIIYVTNNSNALLKGSVRLTYTV